MERQFNAERLTLARHRRGLNKTKLAAKVRLKAPAITAFENADREPSDEMVGRLAEALDFPVGFFYEDIEDVVPLDAASFRSLSRMTAGQRDAALASGTLAMHLNRWIEERFGLPAPSVPDLDPGIINPAGAAAHVRAQWGLDSLPIANVLHTIEAHGVRVFALAAQYKEVDAFSFWHEQSSTPFIIVGTHKTPERQVFDLAHELAHLVLHRDHASPRGRDEERQADEFASNFLMPEVDVRRAAPRNPTLADLGTAKHRWRVSVAALAFRMHKLNLITDWNYHNLCVQISTFGRDREMKSLPREQSQVLGKVLGSLRDQGKGRSDLAAALHVHQPDVDALLTGLVLAGINGDGESTGEPSLRPALRLV